MYDMYKELNDYAKENLLILLLKKIKNEIVLKRCKEEMNDFYDRGLLFIIESLYNYKQQDKSVSYQLDGIKNSLLLSKLRLTDSDSSKSLSISNSICIKFINGCSLDFIEWIERSNFDYRVVTASSDDEDFSKHYLFIPRYVVPKDMTFIINDFQQFETIEDYHQFEDKYIIVRLDDMPVDDYILG